MAELIHDTAPGSPLAFHSAFVSEPDFAQGILDLAKPVAQGGAGAQVITDDVGYFDEPFFQDGIIAQAINTVASQGVSYFSSAGNEARDAYQAAFTPTTVSLPAGVFPGFASTTFQNFGTSGSPNIYQSITIPKGGTIQISLQWDQPYASASTGAPGTAGSQNDLDAYLVNANKTGLVAAAATDNIGGDPVEILTFTNPSNSSSTQFFLAINLFAGAAPGQIKYVNFGDGTINDPNAGAGAMAGHNEAEGAAGVGAAFFGDTPAYGVNPPVVESFSSAGGTAFLFDTAGNRLGTPDLRQQPLITSVDGSDTTFFLGRDGNDGLFSFFGTSAAAPHAAAVAALMKQADPGASPSLIYSTLESTAIDMGTPGFDFDTGFGLIQADRALQALADISISGQVFRDFNGDGVEDGADAGVPGVTVFLDQNNNGVLDTGLTTGPLASIDVPKAIPDASTFEGNPSRVTSSLTVSNVAGRITKVTVMLSINHTFVNDLGLTLISPSGIRVPLFTNVPSNSNQGFQNTVLDDSAAVPIETSGSAPYTGTFRPQVALATLIGDNPDGTWKLEARDYFGGDTGSIQSWSLTITTSEVSTTTNASGGYTFPGLAASSYFGSYQVRDVTPAGFTLSAPASPFSFNLGIGGAATAADFGLFTQLPLTTVDTIAIDDGTAQRSMVRKITVVLNGNVPAANIQAGAFLVAQTSGSPATFSTGIASVTPTAGNTTTIVLTFSGSSIVGASLADGRYTLVIDGSKITDSNGQAVDAAGNGTAGSVSAPTSFFRFFGDSNGDGVVDATDYLAFRTAYLSGLVTVGNSIFDFDGDGHFLVADLTAFNARFTKRKLS